MYCDRSLKQDEEIEEGETKKTLPRMYRKKSERWTKLKNASNISNHKSKIRKKPLTGKPRNIWGSCIKIQSEDCKSDINKYNHTVLDACVLSKTVEASRSTREESVSYFQQVVAS